MGIVGALFLASFLAQEKPPVVWDPASAYNYTVGKPGRKIDYVVMHTIEGTAESARWWFKNPWASVSAHYIVAKDGSIRQMVQHKDIAWHAGNWDYNERSIGIEHEGYAGKNQWTAAQRKASAALARWICLKHKIPMTRARLIGHDEVPGSVHWDPGPYFDWKFYMALVTGGSDTAIPAVQAVKVTVSLANVHAGASNESSIVGQTKVGQRHFVVETAGTWKKVYYAGNVGWVKSVYLTPVSGGKGASIDVSTMNVRGGPSTGHSVVGQAHGGEKYVILTAWKGWRKIYWGSGQYWIWGEYTNTFKF